MIEKDRRFRTEYHAPNSNLEFEEFEEDEDLVGFFEFDFEHIWYGAEL